MGSDRPLLRHQTDSSQTREQNREGKQKPDELSIVRFVMKTDDEALLPKNNNRTSEVCKHSERCGGGRHWQLSWAAVRGVRGG